MPSDHAIATNIRWQRDEGVSLVHHRFGDDTLLFNAQSGSTHRVNDLIIDILHALAEGPANGLELARRLQLDADENKTLNQLEHILHDLDRLGLIMPVDP
ncbi:MAG: HPr-rel-A system PqqD family peptide chaperone [Magnetococcales bacterium]|nr:HPr-rel-A system PqqD family peptide chaperone [Magnetococcales bacterium]MBF0151440.1 HPr-rel-A system PqqD family peptide chaperone [Magnetococcales bacterium]MBF0174378.1 HPr-rel-A system PqqD family peptide chaperone [Magnetococcales bacterium]MBF0348932.1 HPr-rel-A system PqqD family peptide chaperone [Magnetococcales bacterium]